MSLYGPGLSLLKDSKPRLGIIGGSGLCSFPELEVVGYVQSETKYGKPSDKIAICKRNGELVAFLPRHGQEHKIPPHKVPYKANLASLLELGIEYVAATCIVGSLQECISPGSFVVPDQFVNLTWGRDDTFEIDGSFLHLPMGQPYCENTRKLLISSAIACGVATVSSATVAVIQGPRFSTAAESRWLSGNGWDIVNMTQYPECYFAKELGMCYGAIGAVTDYDVGLDNDLTIRPGQMERVLEIFRRNIQETKQILLTLVDSIQEQPICGCAKVTIKTYYEAM